MNQTKSRVERKQTKESLLPDFPEVQTYSSRKEDFWVGVTVFSIIVGSIAGVAYYAYSLLPF